MALVDDLRLSIPLIQAPMPGVSTPALAAAVSEAGGLGTIAVGATNPAGARAMIEDLRRRTVRPFNVNLFVHTTPVVDRVRETACLKAFAQLCQTKCTGW